MCIMIGIQTAYPVALMLRPAPPDSYTSPIPPWLQVSLHPRSLRLLAWYMAILLLVMAVTSLAFTSEQLAIPDRIYWLLMPSQALLTLSTIIAVKHQQRVSAGLYLVLLLCSIALLTWYLYDTGGHTNPVISLLLVPLAMSAALLGWQATSCIAVVVLLAYTLLTQYFIPLGQHQGHSQHFMQLHLIGMWLTFLVSVLLIMGLVLPLALASRAQQQLIAQQQEKMLQNEKLIAMATFAASAAHKLGTPLSTLAILVEDLTEDSRLQPDLQTDLLTMQQQIQICKTTLHDMMRKADNLRQDVRHPIALPALIEQLRQQFNLLHPDRSLNLTTATIPQLMIEGDETLELALLNLLDNAARESQADPQLQLETLPAQICLRIIDSGPGIPEAIRHQLGQPFTTSRQDGLGLGLFLSNTTINRLGGSLRLFSTAHGTSTEVWLPLMKAHNT